MRYRVIPRLFASSISIRDGEGREERWTDGKEVWEIRGLLASSNKLDVKWNAYISLSCLEVTLAKQPDLIHSAQRHP